MTLIPLKTLDELAKLLAERKEENYLGGPIDEDFRLELNRYAYELLATCRLAHKYRDALEEMEARHKLNELMSCCDVAALATKALAETEKP